MLSQYQLPSALSAESGVITDRSRLKTKKVGDLCLGREVYSGEIIKITQNGNLIKMKGFEGEIYELTLPPQGHGFWRFIPLFAAANVSEQTVDVHLLGHAEQDKLLGQLSSVYSFVDPETFHDMAATNSSSDEKSNQITSSSARTSTAWRGEASFDMQLHMQALQTHSMHMERRVASYNSGWDERIRRSMTHMPMNGLNNISFILHDNLLCQILAQANFMKSNSILHSFYNVIKQTIATRPPFSITAVTFAERVYYDENLVTFLERYLSMVVAQAEDTETEVTEVFDVLFKLLFGRGTPWCIYKASNVLLTYLNLFSSSKKKIFQNLLSQILSFQMMMNKHANKKHYEIRNSGCTLRVPFNAHTLLPSSLASGSASTSEHSSTSSAAASDDSSVFTSFVANAHKPVYTFHQLLAAEHLERRMVNDPTNGVVFVLSAEMGLVRVRMSRPYHGQIEAQNITLALHAQGHFTLSPCKKFLFLRSPLLRNDTLLVIHASTCRIHTQTLLKLTQAEYFYEDIETEHRCSDEEVKLELESKRAKKHNDWDEGDNLDVLDTDRKWLGARVLKTRIKNAIKQVYVHYLGFAAKWDEWLPIGSERLAEFRSKSIEDKAKEEAEDGNYPTSIPSDVNNVIIGSKFQVLDNNTWREVSVVHVNSNNQSIKIHYIGWDDKWDEWLEITSSRLKVKSKDDDESGGNGGGDAGVQDARLRMNLAKLKWAFVPRKPSSSSSASSSSQAQTQPAHGQGGAGGVPVLPLLVRQRFEQEVLCANWNVTHPAGGTIDTVVCFHAFENIYIDIGAAGIFIVTTASTTSTTKKKESKTRLHEDRGEILQSIPVSLMLGDRCTQVLPIFTSSIKNELYIVTPYQDTLGQLYDYKSKLTWTIAVFDIDMNIVKQEQQDYWLPSKEKSSSSTSTTSSSSLTTTTTASATAEQDASDSSAPTAVSSAEEPSSLATTTTTTKQTTKPETSAASSSSTAPSQDASLPDWYQAQVQSIQERYDINISAPESIVEIPTSLVDMGLLNQLRNMDFPENRAINALVFFGIPQAPVTLNEVMEWLNQHIDDPDLDDPWREKLCKTLLLPGMSQVQAQRNQTKERQQERQQKGGKRSPSSTAVSRGGASSPSDVLIPVEPASTCMTFNVYIARCKRQMTAFTDIHALNIVKRSSKLASTTEHTQYPAVKCIACHQRCGAFLAKTNAAGNATATRRHQDENAGVESKGVVLVESEEELEARQEETAFTCHVCGYNLCASCLALGYTGSAGGIERCNHTLTQVLPPKQSTLSEITQYKQIEQSRREKGLEQISDRMRLDLLSFRPGRSFNVGDKVFAYWKSGSEVYGAKIKEFNSDGTYKVVYDDNDCDDHCPAENIFHEKPPPIKKDTSENSSSSSSSSRRPRRSDYVEKCSTVLIYDDEKNEFLLGIVKESLRRIHFHQLGTIVSPSPHTVVSSEGEQAAVTPLSSISDNALLNLQLPKSPVFIVSFSGRPHPLTVGYCHVIDKQDAQKTYNELVLWNGGQEITSDHFYDPPPAPPAALSALSALSAAALSSSSSLSSDDAHSAKMTSSSSSDKNNALTEMKQQKEEKEEEDLVVSMTCALMQSVPLLGFIGHCNTAHEMILLLQRIEDDKSQQYIHVKTRLIEVLAPKLRAVLQRVLWTRVVTKCAQRSDECVGPYGFSIDQEERLACDMNILRTLTKKRLFAKKKAPVASSFSSSDDAVDTGADGEEGESVEKKKQQNDEEKINACYVRMIVPAFELLFPSWEERFSLWSEITHPGLKNELLLRYRAATERDLPLMFFGSQCHEDLGPLLERARITSAVAEDISEEPWTEMHASDNIDLVLTLHLVVATCFWQTPSSSSSSSSVSLSTTNSTESGWNASLATRHCSVCRQDTKQQQQQQQQQEHPHQKMTSSLSSSRMGVRTVLIGAVTHFLTFAAPMLLENVCDDVTHAGVRKFRHVLCVYFGILTSLIDELVKSAKASKKKKKKKTASTDVLGDSTEMAGKNASSSRVSAGAGKAFLQAAHQLLRASLHCMSLLPRNDQESRALLQSYTSLAVRLMRLPMQKTTSSLISAHNTHATCAIKMVSAECIEHAAKISAFLYRPDITCLEKPFLYAFAIQDDDQPGGEMAQVFLSCLRELGGGFMNLSTAQKHALQAQECYFAAGQMYFNDAEASMVTYLKALHGNLSLQVLLTKRAKKNQKLIYQRALPKWLKALVRLTFAQITSPIVKAHQPPAVAGDSNNTVAVAVGGGAELKTEQEEAKKVLLSDGPLLLLPCHPDAEDDNGLLSPSPLTTALSTSAEESNVTPFKKKQESKLSLTRAWSDKSNERPPSSSSSSSSSSSLQQQQQQQQGGGTGVPTPLRAVKDEELVVMDSKITELVRDIVLYKAKHDPSACNVTHVLVRNGLRTRRLASYHALVVMDAVSDWFQTVSDTTASGSPDPDDDDDQKTVENENDDDRQEDAQDSTELMMNRLGDWFHFMESSLTQMHETCALVSGASTCSNENELVGLERLIVHIAAADMFTVLDNGMTGARVVKRLLLTLLQFLRAVLDLPVETISNACVNAFQNYYLSVLPLVQKLSVLLANANSELFFEVLRSMQRLFMRSQTSAQALQVSTWRLFMTLFALSTEKMNTGGVFSVGLRGPLFKLCTDTLHDKLLPLMTTAQGLNVAVCIDDTLNKEFVLPTSLLNALFIPGERVKAYWKSTQKSKYGATVEERNPDGTYIVRYDDGDFDSACPESNLFDVNGKRKERPKETNVEEGEEVCVLCTNAIILGCLSVEKCALKKKHLLNSTTENEDEKLAAATTDSLKCTSVRGTCEHVFHRHCLTNWMQEKQVKNCPLCTVPWEVDSNDRTTTLPTDDTAESSSEVKITRATAGQALVSYYQSKVPPGRYSQFAEKFVVGALVDAVDEVGNWYPAMIIDIRHHRILVRYDGWGPYYDRWIQPSPETIQGLLSNSKLDKRKVDPMRPMGGVLFNLAVGMPIEKSKKKTKNSVSKSSHINKQAAKAARLAKLQELAKKREQVSMRTAKTATMLEGIYGSGNQITQLLDILCALIDGYSLSEIDVNFITVDTIKELWELCMSSYALPVSVRKSILAFLGLILPLFKPSALPDLASNLVVSLGRMSTAGGLFLEQQQQQKNEKQKEGKQEHEHKHRKTKTEEGASTATDTGFFNGQDLESSRANDEDIARVILLKIVRVVAENVHSSYQTNYSEQWWSAICQAALHALQTSNVESICRALQQQEQEQQNTTSKNDQKKQDTEELFPSVSGVDDRKHGVGELVTIGEHGGVQPEEQFFAIISSHVAEREVCTRTDSIQVSGWSYLGALMLLGGGKWTSRIGVPLLVRMCDGDINLNEQAFPAVLEQLTPTGVMASVCRDVTQDMKTGQAGSHHVYIPHGKYRVTSGLHDQQSTVMKDKYGTEVITAFQTQVSTMVSQLSCVSQETSVNSFLLLELIAMNLELVPMYPFVMNTSHVMSALHNLVKAGISAETGPIFTGGLEEALLSLLNLHASGEIYSQEMCLQLLPDSLRAELNAKQEEKPKPKEVIPKPVKIVKEPPILIALTQVLAMGFTLEQAQSALLIHNGVAEAAILGLLDGVAVPGNVGHEWNNFLTNNGLLEDVRAWEKQEETRQKREQAEKHKAKSAEENLSNNDSQKKTDETSATDAKSSTQEEAADGDLKKPTETRLAAGFHMGPDTLCDSKTRSGQTDDRVLASQLVPLTDLIAKGGLANLVGLRVWCRDARKHPYEWALWQHCLVHPPPRMVGSIVAYCRHGDVSFALVRYSRRDWIERDYDYMGTTENKHFTIRSKLVLDSRANVNAMIDSHVMWFRLQDLARAQDQPTYHATRLFHTNTWLENMQQGENIVRKVILKHLRAIVSMLTREDVIAIVQETPSLARGLMGTRDWLRDSQPDGKTLDYALDKAAENVLTACTEHSVMSPLIPRTIEEAAVGCMKVTWKQWPVLRLQYGNPTHVKSMMLTLHKDWHTRLSMVYVFSDRACLGDPILMVTPNGLLLSAPTEVPNPCYIQIGLDTDLETIPVAELNQVPAFALTLFDISPMKIPALRFMRDVALSGTHIDAMMLLGHAQRCLNASLAAPHNWALMAECVSLWSNIRLKYRTELPAIGTHASFDACDVKLLREALILVSACDKKRLSRVYVCAYTRVFVEYLCVFETLMQLNEKKPTKQKMKSLLDTVIAEIVSDISVNAETACRDVMTHVSTVIGWIMTPVKLNADPNTSNLSLESRVMNAMETATKEMKVAAETVTLSSSSTASNIPMSSLRVADNVAELFTSGLDDRGNDNDDDDDEESDLFMSDEEDEEDDDLRMALEMSMGQARASSQEPSSSSASVSQDHNASANTANDASAPNTNNNNSEKEAKTENAPKSEEKKTSPVTEDNTWPWIVACLHYDPEIWSEFLPQNISLVNVVPYSVRVKVLDRMLSRTKSDESSMKTIAIQSTSELDEDTKASVSEQLFDQLFRKEPFRLRTSQSYAWKTQLSGLDNEGVLGLPGPYRKVLTEFCEDVVARAQILPAGIDAPFILCPNGRNQQGEDRNKLVVNPAHTGLQALSNFYTIGLLLGCSIRTNATLNLDLHSSVWELLMYGSRSVMKSDNAMKENNAVVTMDASLGLFFKTSEANVNALEAAVSDLNWTCFLSDGVTQTSLRLKEEPLQASELPLFRSLLYQARLCEAELPLAAIRAGLLAVVDAGRGDIRTPLEWIRVCTRQSGDGLVTLDRSGFFALLTPSELELRVCGSSSVDIDILERMTHYTSQTKPKEQKVISFMWQALRELSEADKGRFLQFVWARSRLPFNMEHGREKMTVNVDTTKGDGHRPTSQTCFFMLEMPNYSTLEVTKARLQEALECTQMNY